MVVAVLTWGLGTFTALGATSTEAISCGVSGGLNAGLNGGDFSDILRCTVVQGAQGAISAGFLHGLGEAAGAAGTFSAETAIHVAGHGVLGGATNAALGGKFQDGFLSAAASTFAADAGLLGAEGGGAVGIASRTIRASIVGGSASALGGGKFANGAYTAAFQHLLNEEFKNLAEKRAWLSSGKTGANLEVADNPSADGSAPWFADLPHGARQVNLYDSDGKINAISSYLEIDSDLVRSIIFVEESQGWYDYYTGKVISPSTIRPMNVHAKLWNLDCTKLTTNRYYNISAGSLILKSISNNIAPGSGIAHIATLYNSLGASSVTPYGARVQSV